LTDGAARRRSELLLAAPDVNIISNLIAVFLLAKKLAKIRPRRPGSGIEN
jgi:hypothetical protein